MQLRSAASLQPQKVTLSQVSPRLPRKDLMKSHGTKRWAVPQPQAHRRWRARPSPGRVSAPSMILTVSPLGKHVPRSSGEVRTH